MEFDDILHDVGQPGKDDPPPLLGAAVDAGALKVPDQPVFEGPVRAGASNEAQHVENIVTGAQREL